MSFATARAYKTASKPPYNDTAWLSSIAKSLPPAIAIENVAALIGDDEVITVEEADRRLSNLFGRRDNPTVVVNGLPSRVANLVTAGLWQHAGPDTLRRRHLEPPPAVTPVWRPIARTPEQRLAALEAPKQLPVVQARLPRPGHAYLHNPTRMVLHCFALQRKLAAGEVVEVATEVAERARSPIFRIIGAEELSALMAA